MDFLKALGAIGIDPTDLVKKLATHATAQFAGPIIAQYFNTHMNAAARVELGRKLVDIGTDLQTGHVADAGNALAGVIEDVKF